MPLTESTNIQYHSLSPVSTEYLLHLTWSCLYSTSLIYPHLFIPIWLIERSSLWEYTNSFVHVNIHNWSPWYDLSLSFVSWRSRDIIYIILLCLWLLPLRWTCLSACHGRAPRHVSVLDTNCSATFVPIPVSPCAVADISDYDAVAGVNCRLPASCGRVWCRHIKHGWLLN